MWTEKPRKSRNISEKLSNLLQRHTLTTVTSSQASIKPI